MSTTLELRTRSGAAIPGGLLLLLTYTDVGGGERIERMPGARNTVVEPRTRGGQLTRIGAFAPPGDLVFDKAFALGCAWPASLTVVIDDLAGSRDQPATVSRPGIGAALRRAPVSGRLRNSRPVTLVSRVNSQVPEIAGLRIGGEVGTPSLPVEMHYVLVPPGMRPQAATAIPDPVPIRVPVSKPHLVPEMVLDSPHVLASPRRQEAATTPAIRLSPALGRLVSATVAAAATQRTPTPVADGNILRGGRTRVPMTYPAQPVQLRAVAAHPWGSVATVSLSPVQYSEGAGAYVHQPNLGFRLDYTGSFPAAANLFPDIATREHADLLTATLANPQASLPPGALLPGKWLFDPAATFGTANAGMIVITDDTNWNGTTANPPFLGQTKVSAGAAIPKNSSNRGMVAEFERLAYWKTCRGMRTKVVPISAIVKMHGSGELSAFLPGPALDLPEMIRAFIAWAVKTWHTTFVLLGGAPAVVPMRLLHAGRGPEFVRGQNATLIPTGSGRYVAWLTRDKAQAEDLAEAPVDVDESFSLLCVSSGIVLPYSTNTTTGHGWCFKQIDFGLGDHKFPPAGSGVEHALSVMAFGGPEIQDDFAWVWPGRACESDQYYSDLTRAPTPQRDFDANGNGMLGQSTANGQADVPVDGMSVQGSVYVGRAPVRDAGEARAFVDKVIGYEMLGGKDAPIVDPAYLTQIASYCDNWIHPWNFAQYPAPPADPKDTKPQVPQPGQFVARPDSLIAKLQDDEQLATVMGKATLDAVPPYSLQAIFEGAGTVIDIPFDQTGKKAICWFFCDKDFVRLTPAKGATGSAFIRVMHPPAGLDILFWQSPTVDYGAVQKERVHAQFGSLFPALNQRRRLYRDYVNFPGQDVEHVTQKDANALLDTGSHFLSVTGHGNVNNQGYIRVRGCANFGRPTIMYFHSCLTANPAVVSLGQSMVAQKNGALAYVGYARSCWTGDPVADYELGFWCGVAAYRRLGPPIALHLNPGGWQQFGHVFMTTLYGDPEMPVWTSPPRRPVVQFIYNVVQDGMFKGAETVSVQATFGGKPVPGLLVTAVQGWISSTTDPEFFSSTTTDDSGFAFIVLRSPRKGAVRVVVSTSPAALPSQLFAPTIKDYAAGQTK